MLYSQKPKCINQGIHGTVYENVLLIIQNSLKVKKNISLHNLDIILTLSLIQQILSTAYFSKTG